MRKCFLQLYRRSQAFLAEQEGSYLRKRRGAWKRGGRTGAPPSASEALWCTEEARRGRTVNLSGVIWRNSGAARDALVTRSESRQENTSGNLRTWRDLRASLGRQSLSG
ncbi:hypothetical protein NDU88_001513 [Pleurodeles waltl]|uniref:Uncharacterized protein n=1 Tax=Pleurodeles waltl TaxID=8319 RepID=A0AAV7VC16_PLEWA|nr:hypothetical protein NDU88_001513 [Pleurodeles waltl]